MKKIALLVALFVTLHALPGCTPRPEDDMPIGDSLRTEVPMGDTLPVNTPRKSENRQADPTRENYILPMDTVHVGYQDQSMVITVGGPLGDGCQKFEYIDSVKEGSTLRLTFWASRPKAKDVVCTQQMQYVEREIRVGQSDYARLAVVQPKGSPLMRTLSEQ